MHYPVDTIQYFHASLNTKKKKIIEFLPIDTSNNYKVDPVVFALSVDPLAKKYPGISPYAFTLNNPIWFTDVDGREVFIYGKDAQSTVAALSKVTSLKIEYDAKTNQLSASGEAKTALDRELLGAISDKGVKVGLQTTRANFYDSKDATKNIPILIGGYEGSEVKDGIVETKQFFNLEQSQKVEKAGLSTVGTDAAHEILESFYGGKDDPGGDYTSGFENAHKKAIAADPTAKDLFPNKNTKTNSLGVTDGKGTSVDLINLNEPKTKVEDEK